MTEALALVITLVFQLLMGTIFIRVILSWLPAMGVRIDPYNPVIQLLFSVTNPILEPLRPYCTIDMMDFSPFVALLGLYIIQGMLLALIGVG